MTSGVIAIMVAICLLCSIVVIAYLYYMRIWFRAAGAGLRLSLLQIVGMSLRGVSLYKVVWPYVRAREVDIQLDLDELIALHREGVDVRTTVNAMIRAKRAGENLTFDQAHAAR